MGATLNPTPVEIRINKEPGRKMSKGYTNKSTKVTNF